jgi:hypothetical protein
MQIEPVPVRIATGTLFLPHLGGCQGIVDLLRHRDSNSTVNLYVYQKSCIGMRRVAIGCDDETG